jgi:DNA-binding transcriptional MocR family regulator
MSELKEMKESELQDLIQKLQQQYDDFKAQKLNLDMSRGKPCPEQLDLSMGMLDCLASDSDYKASDGMDCRNYGAIDGIPEAKELFGEMLGVSAKEIIIGGNSSLSLMYDTILRAMLFGVLGSEKPWGRLPSVKFLCPSPGYDRHFAICQNFNIEMIVIDMKADGPDMDVIEKLVSTDNSIKGIWCIPKYSNPDGITYSDEVVDRLAKMQTKAKDFRIFWDNAYAVHHLSKTPDQLKNILTACKEAGNADRVFIFSSTSKITFPGAGIAMMGASENNINYIKKQISLQTIGPDKMNQLRHVRFLKDMDGIKNHMYKHAAILKPKFDTVIGLLEAELGKKGIAWWNKPNGGYFISLNTLPGCAREVVAMASEAGVKLTNAGATFPYGKDPLDRNIRIAPTFPPISELKKAIELLCICVQLVSAKKLLKEM